MKIERIHKKTCFGGAFSSMNGAARLIKEASPTPTNLNFFFKDLYHVDDVAHLIEKKKNKNLIFI